MKEELIGLVEDYGEIALDSCLEDGLLKDIPIIGTAFSTIKIYKDIRDIIFVEKLKTFLLSVEKNDKWKERFTDEKECLNISKHLLYIIDHCDDDQKLRLIGLAFNHFVIDEINQEEYFWIVEMITKSYYPFLEILKDIDPPEERFVNDGTKYDFIAVSHLLNIGALDYDGQTIAVFENINGKGKPGAIIVAMNFYGMFIKSLLD